MYTTHSSTPSHSAFLCLKALILLFFLVAGSPLFAQLSEDQGIVLRKEISQHINELRTSLGLKPLQADAILRKAAKLQSAFMAKTRHVTHNHRETNLKTPAKRVEYYGGMTFEIVGENVLSSAPIDQPLDEKMLVELGKEMFFAWKNSPGHYANMVHPDYKMAGIDFFIGKDNKVYATHVFGTKGVKIEGQLSSNSFGLQKHPDCSKAFKNHENLVANVGNDFLIEGDKVYFYYHDKPLFDRIFDGRDDGIAIDLLDNSQFACGTANQMDLSPVHDGILLKPVFRNELLQNNTAQSDYRIITEVGQIPAALQGKELSPAVVLIKDGKKCKYLVPGNVPSKNYRLRPIKPLLYNPPNVQLQAEGIVKFEQLEYDFKKNEAIPVEYPLMHKTPLKMHSIEILSFSSVEGDEKKNTILHNKRAATMQQHILKELGAKGVL